MSEEKLPYAYYKLPKSQSLNERLREPLLALSATVPGRVTNAPGGRPIFWNKWLSHPNLHLDGPAVFRELTEQIEYIAGKVTRQADSGRPPLRVTSMWGLVSQVGTEGKRHVHGGLFSSVYYVDAGRSGESAGGLLQFYADQDKAEPSHVVTPEPGLLIIFPSRLEHSVSCYSAEAPRILISASMELLTQGSAYEIEVARERFGAGASPKPVYDPKEEGQ